MMQALRIASTGMHAQQTNVDVLSNNIANLNTIAFKQNVSAFNDLMYQSRVGVGAITSANGTIAPTGAQIGLGVEIGSVYRIMEQGTVTETSNSFDFAIQGRGFLRVQNPNGNTEYTRDGAFQLDASGQLVSREGFPVDPSITIPADATDVTVTESGIVSATVAGTVTQLGTLTVSMFPNEAGLKNVGNNRYIETDASGSPTDANPGEDGAGTILQGHLEDSNVDPIESITQLITAQRAYELNSRIISTADEMLNALNQIR